MVPVAISWLYVCILELCGTSSTRTVSGAAHKLTLHPSGEVFAVGSNDYGQLGDGTMTQRRTPVLVLADVQDVAAGTFHSVFLMQNGSLYSAGWNAWGQLGDHCRCHPGIPECQACLWGRPAIAEPVLVENGVQSVAAGAAHTVYLMSDGAAYTTGWNHRGQLGDSTVTSRRSPVLVQTGVRAVAAGESHTLFLKNNDTVLASGANDFGQLGDGTKRDQHTPVTAQTGVQSMIASATQSLFYKRDGTTVVTRSGME